MAWGDVLVVGLSAQVGAPAHSDPPRLHSSLSLQGPPRDLLVPAFHVSAQVCPRTSLHLDVSLFLKKKI